MSLTQASCLSDVRGSKVTHAGNITSSIKEHREEPTQARQHEVQQGGDTSAPSAHLAERPGDVHLNSSGDHYTALLASIAITLIATCKMATKDYARTVSPMEVIQIVNQLQAEGVFQNTGPAARVIN
jgi:hypothetical protein